MKITLILGALLLAGCGTAPPPTQIVEVPVYTSCVKDVPVAPEYEFDKLPLNAADGAKVIALARDWARARKYELLLQSVVYGCA